MHARRREESSTFLLNSYAFLQFYARIVAYESWFRQQEHFFRFSSTGYL